MIKKKSSIPRSGTPPFKVLGLLQFSTSLRLLKMVFITIGLPSFFNSLFRVSRRVEEGGLERGIHHDSVWRDKRASSVSKETSELLLYLISNQIIPPNGSSQVRRHFYSHNLFFPPPFHSVQFQVLLTHLSVFFSHFLHSTCALSVFTHIFRLNRSIPAKFIIQSQVLLLLKERGY